MTTRSTKRRNLVQQHSVSGKPARDARIAAAMIVHGITHILTLNVGDFKRFPKITVLHPAEMTTG